MREGLELFHSFISKSNQNRDWKNARILFRCLKARDQHTAKHSLLVAYYSYHLSHYMDLEPEIMFLGGLLHDIGKISMEDHILKSSRKLTEKERNVLHKHVEEGVNILQEAQFPKQVINFCLYHHERLNGKGYPNQVTSIPKEGRLAGVVDVFSALTMPRIYHTHTYTKEEAIEIIKDEHSKYRGFDLTVIKYLIEYIQLADNNKIYSLQD